MPYEPLPDLHGLSLEQIGELAAARKLPPVESWHPEITGESEMRIATDGRWYHQGSEIKRPAMIRAFSSLLLCDEAGQHWLVTPQERLKIAVDDAPLHAIEMQLTGTDLAPAIAFKLKSDDIVVADSDHPIVLREIDDEWRPYILARGRLWAQISRAVYYELAEIALSNDPDAPYVISNGARFSFQAAL
jgi:uncharacterized protein